MMKLGQLEPKRIEFRALATFGVLNGLSVGLLNLCLGYNSVGFYQMSKLAIIPFTVLLQTLFYGKTFRSVFLFLSSRASLFIPLKRLSPFLQRCGQGVHRRFAVWRRGGDCDRCAAQLSRERRRSVGRRCHLRRAGLDGDSAEVPRRMNLTERRQL